MRVRIKYSIKGKIRFISHLDLMRIFFRACRKADVPVEISGGYSPHLRMSFGPPLNVGTGSLCEYLDIFLTESVDIPKLKTNLQRGMPKGIEIKETFLVSDTLPQLSAAVKEIVYSVKIPERYGDNVYQTIDAFILKSSIIVHRNTRKSSGKEIKKAIDIRPLVKKLLFIDGYLHMCLVLGECGNVKPIEVISCMWPSVSRDELLLWQVNREEMSGI